MNKKEKERENTYPYAQFVYVHNPLPAFLRRRRPPLESGLERFYIQAKQGRRPADGDSGPCSCSNAAASTVAALPRGVVRSRVAVVGAHGDGHRHPLLPHRLAVVAAHAEEDVVAAGLRALAVPRVLWIDTWVG